MTKINISLKYHCQPICIQTQIYLHQVRWTQVMVTPTQNAVPNNSDNVGSPQHAMMQAHVRSQIVKNYSTMPKCDGVLVDRDNI